MLALVIGVVALVGAFVMFLFTAIMVVQYPVEGLVGLLPPILLVWYGIHRVNSRERLRKAIFMYKLQETNRSKPF